MLALREHPGQRNDGRWHVVTCRDRAHDVDDALVTRLIGAAQSWLEAQLGYPLAEEFPDEVPGAVEHAILLMVGHYYANREATTVGATGAVLPLGVGDIVNDWRKWSWGENDN